jgi:hypothetical protein
MVDTQPPTWRLLKPTDSGGTRVSSVGGDPQALTGGAFWPCGTAPRRSSSKGVAQAVQPFRIHHGCPQAGHMQVRHGPGGVARRSSRRQSAVQALLYVHPVGYVLAG